MLRVVIEKDWSKMKCPMCGCQKFFVKDPEDEYEVFPFDVIKGEVRFDSDVDAVEAPKVDDKTDVIEDIKVKTFGCVAAIATSSQTTELAKGKTLREAYAITKTQVADDLGGLPKQKMHCSNLAVDALQRAIKNYLKENNRSIGEFENGE